jgi:CheY-like chemotaxis protein
LPDPNVLTLPTRDRRPQLSLGERTILVVAPDTLVRLGVRDMLEDLGNTVFDAATPGEAYAQFVQYPDIDLILTEFDADGRALLARCRALRDVPAILATDKRSTRENWGDVIMRKPYSLEALGGALIAVARQDALR